MVGVRFSMAVAAVDWPLVTFRKLLLQLVAGLRGYCRAAMAVFEAAYGRRVRLRAVRLA